MAGWMCRARSVALLAVAAVTGGAAAAEPTSPPNVVIFLADDLGWGDLGCYGHQAIKTPHLDAFAKEGVRLTQCYSASAVCSPSRSAILTGRTPHRNGVFTWIAQGSEVHLRREELALPRRLRERGYATAHAGKWHLNGKFNLPDHPQPNDHGYDWWLATQNNAAPSHQNPTNFVRNGKPVGKVDGYSAVIVADEAIDWLRKHRDKSKPFFLTVWTHEPHLPIESDPAFQEQYAAIADPEIRQHHGNVSQLDHAFGRLMAELEKQGLAKETFVFFTSDNGPEGDGVKGRSRGSTGGLRGRKRAMYEGGIRVPGIARWPGRIAPATTADVPVVGSDLYPTVLALAGTSPPADRTLDGVDVGAILTGKASAVARPIPLYWRLGMAPHGLHVAFRKENWKLLASQAFDRFELYDLAADPHETTDLATRETERFEAMRRELVALNGQIEAEGPDWWKRLNADGGRPPGEARPKAEGKRAKAKGG